MNLIETINQIVNERDSIFDHIALELAYMISILSKRKRTRTGFNLIWRILSSFPGSQ